ncbi:MAG TPA: class I SAM-dependent methyltransferase, partial [Tepidisphaeraceae bacterium]|nr:class I SAM-dependent methyltransferase [Tepidisphaeraceae bacterium]
MFRIEDTHWWYVSKQRIVSELISRYASPTGQNGAPRRLRIADLGCGCGAMLNKLKAAHDVVGVDPSPLAIEFSARRGIVVQKGSFPNEIPLAAGEYDVVMMLDVIEHLQDDYAGVKTAGRLLDAGGIMVITVPAYQWLWSDWDELHHHFRRYNRKMLRDVVASNGLDIELLSYANTTLFPLAAAARGVHNL